MKHISTNITKKNPALTAGFFFASRAKSSYSRSNNFYAISHDSYPYKLTHPSPRFVSSRNLIITGRKQNPYFTYDKYIPDLMSVNITSTIFDLLLFQSFGLNCNRNFQDGIGKKKHSLSTILIILTLHVPLKKNKNTHTIN